MLLGIDAGGTFTDFVCVELGSQIGLKIHKTLSTPAAPEQAIMDGIRAMGLESAMKSGSLYIIHGSTVATNAVLEGKLAKTAFVTNYGFADMLQLARQTRPELYKLEFAARPPPVAADLCLETGGRLAADGSVIEPLSETELHQLVEKLRSLKPDAIAINLLFSFLDDSFEQAIAAAIHAAGLPAFVSCSSTVLPEYKEYERGIATWLNAALGPIVSGYIGRLQEQLGTCPIQIMQSTGESMAADKAANSAVNLLLSGPAGGLAAVRFLGKQLGIDRIISFDMGGTSTDVALLEGDISITNEGFIAHYPVAVPMVDMHTIGAGGGSIALVDSGGMLQVGPRSAGAEPGPACYNKGGAEATVTDANLVLGRLLPEAALAGSLKLDRQQAVAVIRKLAVPLKLSVEETALGIITIANEHMAKAIRLISVNRGYDPREFVLTSFGGAGGLHVCAIADAMLMHKAIVPVHCGVLSALGMVVANRGRQFSKTVSIASNNINEAELLQEFVLLQQHGIEQLQEEGLSDTELQITRSVDMCYVGQSCTLNVLWEDPQASINAFHLLHKKRYGYSLQTDTELVNLRVKVSAPSRDFKLPEIMALSNGNIIDHTRVYGDAGEVKMIARAGMDPEKNIEGPAIISEYSATTFIAPSWTARVDRLGNLLLDKIDP